MSEWRPPDALQSTILAGHLSLPPGQPEDLAMEPVMQNFGGMATSRLNRNLRLDKHWSYGSVGRFTSVRGPRNFFAHPLGNQVVEAHHRAAPLLQLLAQALLLLAKLLHQHIFFRLQRQQVAVFIQLAAEQAAFATLLPREARKLLVQPLLRAHDAGRLPLPFFGVLPHVAQPQRKLIEGVRSKQEHQPVEAASGF